MPQPDARMPRFSPVFAATFRPGSATVPLAERVIALTFKSSTLITSKRRARLVEVFSHQSFRRPVSRAFSRATAILTSHLRRDPGRALASLRSNRRRRACSRRESPGHRNNSPADRATDTATPRSMPATSPLPGAAIGSGMAANATCQCPVRSRVTRYDLTSSGTGRDNRNRTQPSFGTFTSAWFRFSRRMSLGPIATTRKPSFSFFLLHLGRRRVPLKKAAMLSRNRAGPAAEPSGRPPAAKGSQHGRR